MKAKPGRPSNESGDNRRGPSDAVVYVDETELNISGDPTLPRGDDFGCNTIEVEVEVQSNTSYPYFCRIGTTD